MNMIKVYEAYTNWDANDGESAFEFDQPSMISEEDFFDGIGDDWQGFLDEYVNGAEDFNCSHPFTLSELDTKFVVVCDETNIIFRDKNHNYFIEMSGYLDRVDPIDDVEWIRELEELR